MSEVIEDNKIDEPKTEKRLDALKKKADLLGITYPKNIGETKLKEKIDLHMEDMGGNEVTNEVSVGPDQKIRDLEAKAKKPMLVIVNDLDSSQLSDPTIVTNIGNKYFKVGCITQKGKEQIVPSAVVEALKAKTMVQWEDETHAITKRPTGNRVARTSKRFNITIVDENPKMDK